MKILTPSGFKDFAGVKRKLAPCYNILFEDNSTIVCSTDHKFKVKGRTVEAAALACGISIDSVNGPLMIIDMDDAGLREVYTPIEVENHEYLSKGIINGNCSFIGSTNTLISGETLDRLMPEEEKMFKYGYDMKIFEEPVPDALYLMGVDVAGGTAGDSSTVQVVKILNPEDIIQVATYERNTIKPQDFAAVVDAINHYYNDCLMVVENNDIGKILLDELVYKIGNGNVMNTDSKGGLGTRATSKTKLEACMELKRLLEINALKIKDNKTIDQLSRFEETAPNVFKAANNAHDDLVSALYWIAYGTMQPQIDMEAGKIRTFYVEGNNEYIPPVIGNDVMDENFFWSDFR